MGCGVVQRHLEMAQPTTKILLGIGSVKFSDLLRKFNLFQIKDLDEERRKREQDTAQGDDITYCLEKDRTNLKQVKVGRSAGVVNVKHNLWITKNLTRVTNSIVYKLQYCSHHLNSTRIIEVKQASILTSITTKELYNRTL